jgi:hypothetical protein
MFSAEMLSQSGRCPSTPELGNGNFSEHWLKGYIGKRQARMYLAIGNEGVAGAFYYTDDWDPIMLGGKHLKDGFIQLSARKGDSKQVGGLTATLKTNTLAGVWISLDKQEARLRLKAVPKPHCETDNRQWRRFDDPRWPITFQYPASWHIASDGDSVTLTCPDPEPMAYEGFNISISHGIRHTDDDIGFIRCGKDWYGATCDCSNLTGVFCDMPAEVTQKDGMTLISGDTAEWRGYCRGGGYMGETEGHRHVILIGDKWVQFIGEGTPSELIDEILPTIRQR